MTPELKPEFTWEHIKLEPKDIKWFLDGEKLTFCQVTFKFTTTLSMAELENMARKFAEGQRTTITVAYHQLTFPPLDSLKLPPAQP